MKTKQLESNTQKTKFFTLPEAPSTTSPVPWLMSIHATRRRGEYGSPSYRGNCGGYLIKDLLRYFRPKNVLDVLTGGGTCEDVCRELGTPCTSSDVKQGFDATNSGGFRNIGTYDSVKKHRKQRSMTQAALAKAAGLTMPTVRFLEQTRGTLASWDAALVSLRLELAGRNLPPGKAIGNRIAALRRSRNLSQRELARLVEVTHPTILAMERQGRGRLETLNRILSQLGAGAYLAPVGEKKAFYTHAGNASTNAAWETPLEFLDRLYSVFGKFDLDPCSPRKTRPPVKARMHYTAEDDGLSFAWCGTVFVNPPYGRELPDWIAKAAAEVEQGNARTVVALIPARTDTKYWHQHIAAKADVWFLKGRLRFQNATACAPFPSAVVVWGADEATIAKLDAVFSDAWKSSKSNLVK